MSRPYRAPARPQREVTTAELEMLHSWLRLMTAAPDAHERIMLAIEARPSFKGWPCIVCRTCEARNRQTSPGGPRYRMTISGVVDHYRRAFGYEHELAIDDATVRVIT